MTTTGRRDVGRGPVRGLVVVTYLAMVATNYLANALPLNGRRTGDVSDAYPSLFTPAGYAFSIWLVIYLLLGLHVVYQLGWIRDRQVGDHDSALLNRVGLLFSISSLANTAWVFAWHYDAIALSAVLIVVILVCLILIAGTLRGRPLSVRGKWLIALPFSVYFGWTTVATVANITVLLVSLGWDGFGGAAPVWAAGVIVGAAVLGAATMMRNRDVAYGLVLLWAYIAILVRQTSGAGLAGRYPGVMVAVIGSLVIFLAAELLVMRRLKKAAPLA